MNGWTPVDAEALLVQEVTRLIPDIYVCAPPLPANIEQTLPHILITRTGGSRTNIVMDEHQLSIDVRAPTWAQATNLADQVTGSIAQLADDPHSLNDWRAATILTLPYANPDPSHPTIPRMTSLVSLSCRPITIN